MAPRTRSSSRQGVKNDPERVMLLGETLDSPNDDISPRCERDTSAVSQWLKIRKAAKMTIRMRIRSQTHGQRLSLLLGQPDVDRKGPIERKRSKEPTKEALRLDWMRRLRPKPHRRV
ncbi:hypothetical protein N7466_001594 [Penicillium verhagenii]|uniref:uncharacterized protein n=1 Tax=Penicillium verhagenii TaxID=1562060 RepID=UPI002544EADE|nr:uncharacterized protein N7466_001499 [Penicillium verhagenii]XP_057024277.1 uncharacterized protein N7466_001594 [Penicillium verhagenii]KAJ5938365.1 hypothetical protein N7466_001499 [Penicillium verhagenii]KAJ5938460.1 hypothetical protein N7466_001594 [Penicillium verhagenii]